MRYSKSAAGRERGSADNTDGNWYANSVTHTTYEPEACWPVDPGSARQTGSIQV
jgi:hypothetical protein